MRRHQLLWVFLAVLGVGLPQPVLAQHTGEVRIGLVKTLFRDVPPGMVEMAAAPFGMLMRQQAGVAGNAVLVDDSQALGAQLQGNKVQLGVFNGFEFAWAQQRHPDLKPLVIVVNHHQRLFAHLVVRHDSPARLVADLKDSHLALPQRTREHCHLFLNRLCREAGLHHPEHFGQVSRPVNKHKALDDLVRGKVQAVLIDGVSLEGYQELKPGYHQQLKVLHKSEAFPAVVIAYRGGHIDDATAEQIRNGLLAANRSERARELMVLWGVTGFEAPPQDYQQTLDSTLKAYPPGNSPAQAVAGEGKIPTTTQGQVP